MKKKKTNRGCTVGRVGSSAVILLACHALTYCRRFVPCYMCNICQALLSVESFELLVLQWTIKSAPFQWTVPLPPSHPPTPHQPHTFKQTTTGWGGGGGEGTELTTLKFDLKLNSLQKKKGGGGTTLIPSSLPLSGVQFLISVFRKYSPGTVAGLRHGASEGAATFGSSGAVTKSHSSQGVFEGQGHTLRGSSSVEDVMPQDEVPLTGSIRGAARRLQDLCDPQHQASIDEEPEGMEVGEVKVKAQTDGAGTGDEGYPQVDVGFGAFVCVWGGGGRGGCVCVWESMRVYVRTCVCVYMFVWVCICVWEHVCVCVCACMCVCVHAYSCACLC